MNKLIKLSFLFLFASSAFTTGDDNDSELPIGEDKCAILHDDEEGADEGNGLQGAYVPPEEVQVDDATMLKAIRYARTHCKR